MSTPNPTHIDIGAMALLDALRNDETNWIGQRQWDPATARLHFEHVVSKLTDAGYSIVKREALARAFLIPVAATVIAVACYGLYLALRESDAERALTYPLGSPERLILEGGQ